MRLSAGLLLLLFGLVAAAPAPNSGESNESKESKESKESGESDRLTITKHFYPDSFVVYKGKHDIVNILVPLNSLNFDEDSEDDDTSDDDNTTVFFVEADKDAKGKRIDRGLYVLKGGKATKILDNGRDAAASSDNSKEVFFGAQDGIYTYNQKDNTAVKYGSVTDSIIGIAKENITDAIYILTEDNIVYKVTESGEKKEKVENVDGALEIVLDYSDNLYYYGADKQPYVLTADGVQKINGLPEHPKSVRLVKPPFVIEEGVPFISDNEVYFIYPNGTSEVTGFDFKPNAKPTAYGIEATLIQYYGYNKKIYEYNILAILLNEAIDELKNFLETKSSTIQSMSTRSRSKMHGH
ncbi:uncharacterized protein [Battus philenor]|uniref:uncharacterized protein n=1 Tax=Battus philenor TaxID=42288 RepID=UPI0035CF1F16